jgi:phosphate transport system substrate-binding protein
MECAEVDEAQFTLPKEANMCSFRCLCMMATFVLLSLGSVQLAPAGEITARGSDSTSELMKALATAYQKETGNIVKVEGGGSSKGAKSALAGEVNLAFLSRELKEEEKAASLVGVAYALDAIAVIVHKNNPVSGLSTMALKDIFVGKTATWGDNKPIVLYNRNPDSGTRETFQELVLKDAMFSDKAAVKHDGVLLPSISKVPTAVAYTSVGHVNDTVKVLPIDGVMPTPATVRDKTYPLSRTLTLATKGTPSADVKAFIDFVLSDKGQKLAMEKGYVSLGGRI